MAPAKYKDGLLLVELRLNGQPAVFMVDTGAKTSLISERAYKKAPSWDGDRRLQDGHLSGLGGSGSSIFVARVRIGIGRVNYGVQVGVTDLPKYLDGADGILGSDVLRQFKRVDVDYKAREVTFVEDEPGGRFSCWPNGP